MRNHKKIMYEIPLCKVNKSGALKYTSFDISGLMVTVPPKTEKPTENSQGTY
jgi:hypothetical protein